MDSFRRVVFGFETAGTHLPYNAEVLGKGNSKNKSHDRRLNTLQVDKQSIMTHI